jgi:hypothetical protein
MIHRYGHTIGDEMIIMTPETVVPRDLAILFPKELSIRYSRDEHIVFDSEKEVCDCIIIILPTTFKN